MSESMRIDPLVQAAFLAGRGASADEIAAEVGARSGDAIAEALRLYNIRLEAKPFGARVLPVRVIGSDLAPLKAAADKRGIPVPDLVARIVGTVSREISIDGLLDDLPQGPRR